MINTRRDAQRGIPLKAQVAWVQPGWDTCLLALALVGREEPGGEGPGMLREHGLGSPGDQHCPGGSHFN